MPLKAGFVLFFETQEKSELNKCLKSLGCPFLLPQDELFKVIKDK